MAKSSLLEKLMKSSTLKHVDVMADSEFFNHNDVIKTKLTILNIAMSGSIHGGLTPGVTTIAAPSAHFKSILGLYLVAAYLEFYKDAICIFYDSEFGSPPEYMNQFDIDTSRVLHCPVTSLEDLRTDLVNQLKEINRDDRVIIFVDSIGNLASLKETKDAEEGNSAADFTRAKVIRSLFRIVTPQMLLKNIPCVVINQVYDSMDKYDPHTMSGGKGLRFASNQVFYISKAQEKDGTELTGYKFTISANKSRFVREKSKFPLTVLFEGGINKFSGLLELAIDIGMVEKPSQGWYSRVIDGAREDKKWRAKDTNSDEFWDPLFADPEFDRLCIKNFKLGKGESNPVDIEDPELEFDDDELESA